MGKENKFDYTQLAGFYFGEGTYEENTALSSKARSRLATAFHEEAVDPAPNSLLESAKFYAEMLAERVLDDVTVEKGENRSIDVLSGGEKVASFKVDVYVGDEDLGALMPNGDYGEKLQHYGWEDFEKLESVIKKQEAEAEDARQYRFPAEGIAADAEDMQKFARTLAVDLEYNSGTADRFRTLFVEPDGTNVIDRVEIVTDGGSRVTAVDLYTKTGLIEGREAGLKEHMEEAVARIADGYYDDYKTQPAITGDVQADLQETDDFVRAVESMSEDGGQTL